MVRAGVYHLCIRVRPTYPLSFAGVSLHRGCSRRVFVQSGGGPEGCAMAPPHNAHRTRCRKRSRTRHSVGASANRMAHGGYVVARGWWHTGASAYLARQRRISNHGAFAVDHRNILSLRFGMAALVRKHSSAGVGA